MSKDSDLKDLKYHIDWLEKSIVKDHIKFYNYSDFQNKSYIGKGSYGKVCRISWKKKQIFALKSFNNSQFVIKEIVEELKLHRNVNYHENLIWQS
ncbi:6261_t:CDS:2 [Funneliformis caledonium]|uniref:6261_t:CDS:1 n=1 Tax=Funneliformis caledonium TaxID=1117310 RepID=A0A9N8Z863_9GLOM|nr:6261_t:CDS:2 [Funneliformis caledonium]